MKYFVPVTIFSIMTFIFCTKSFADVSYADLFLDGKGYKPAGEQWQIDSALLSEDGKNELPKNRQYKEWCKEMFEGGEQIYEAYREIAFAIDYHAEPPKTDHWQTPVETRKSKQGDCEDSVFLFFSKLSQLNIDGEIVWGWVINKENEQSFAHVWYQLFDKYGSLYIVEGFSREWNGIIPVKLLDNNEERIPNFILRHNVINKLANGSAAEFLGPIKEIQYSWNMHPENTYYIKDIFHKLQKMFKRYREQITCYK